MLDIYYISLYLKDTESTGCAPFFLNNRVHWLDEFRQHLLPLVIHLVDWAEQMDALPLYGLSLLTIF
jgi:hypothetical protein